MPPENDATGKNDVEIEAGLFLQICAALDITLPASEWNAALAKAPAKQPDQKQKCHAQVQQQLKELAQKISWAFCVTPTDATTGGRIYILSDPPVGCDLEPDQSRQATFVSTSLAGTAWSERTTDSRYIKPLLTEATSLCLDNDIPLAWLWEKVKAFVMLESTRIEEPRATSFDPEELAYSHMQLGDLEEGPTPAFDEFLSRIDQPEVFEAPSGE